MGGFSMMHWLLFGGIAILVLGGGRFSNMMGDVAKGIKNFKKGMAEEDEAQRPAARLKSQPAPEPNAAPDLQPAKDDRPAA
jgi:sec-independent protein translocase protein TatA